MATRRKVWKVDVCERGAVRKAVMECFGYNDFSGADLSEADWKGKPEESESKSKTKATADTEADEAPGMGM